MICPGERNVIVNRRKKVSKRKRVNKLPVPAPAKWNESARKVRREKKEKDAKYII